MAAPVCSHRDQYPWRKKGRVEGARYWDTYAWANAGDDGDGSAGHGAEVGDEGVGCMYCRMGEEGFIWLGVA